ncbi:zinc ribbon domain-containing protein [bacterium]|nr:MAG: zinc ribbon domain-containing protein [bacterium]
MRCPYTWCHREIPLGGQFCAWCGTKVFPNAPSLSPKHCDHAFSLEGPFCTLCGFDSDAPFDIQPALRLPIAIGLSSLGILAIAGVSFTMATSRDKGLVRVASYLLLPAIALLVVASRFFVPRRVERTR